MVDKVVGRPDYNVGAWADEGELIRPSSDKILTGHIVEKPPFQMVNWIENRQDQGIIYLLQNGISSWNSSMFYPKYAIVMRDGVVYQALENNVRQPPESSTESWVKAFYSRSEGDDLASIIKKIVNEDGFLINYVKKSDPVMDATSKGVGYAFKDATSSGIFLDSDKKVSVKDSGTTTHSFNTISDIDKEDNNKVVTMSDLRKALNRKQSFPIGSIYITTTTANPNLELGYGTWEKYSQGRVLVGQSDASSDPNWTRTNGTTEGSFVYKATIPKDGWGVIGGSMGMQPSGRLITGSGVAEYKEALESLCGAGNDNTADVSTVQPSIVVSIWRRTG